jgi:hypothetical protein
MAVRIALCAGRPLPVVRFLVHISVRGWVDSRNLMRLAPLCQKKNPVALRESDPRPFDLWQSASTNYGNGDGKYPDNSFHGSEGKENNEKPTKPSS